MYELVRTRTTSLLPVLTVVYKIGSGCTNSYTRRMANATWKKRYAAQFRLFSKLHACSKIGLTRLELKKQTNMGDFSTTEEMDA